MNYSAPTLALYQSSVTLLVLSVLHWIYYCSKSVERDV